LEEEIVPMYYSRGADGVPREWVKRMKRSISTNVPLFNTNRMVQEYVEVGYWPSAERHLRLVADNLKRAAELAAWRRKLQQAWGQVRVDGVVSEDGGETLRVGSELNVRARVQLGNLTPDDVEVQLFHGVLDSLGEIAHPHTAPMTTDSAPRGRSAWDYVGTIACTASGQYGFNVRVLPRHADLPNPIETGLVCWGA
jgi:starch phosphorylase